MNASFQPNGLPPNSATGGQPPYLDYNSNYPNAMLNQPPPTPPCTVPNMFTAAAVAANSSKISASSMNGAANSEFPRVANLDQAMFYGNSNGSAPLNKSAGTLQSSLKLHQTPEFSTLLTNNYANFAPNPNAYWQPGKRLLIANSSVFSDVQLKRLVKEPTLADQTRLSDYNQILIKIGSSIKKVQPG